MTVLFKKFDTLDDALTYIANTNNEFNDFIESLDMFDHESYDAFVKVAIKAILDRGVPSVFHQNFPNTYQLNLNPYQINIRPPYCNYAFAIRPIVSKSSIGYTAKISINLDNAMLDYNPIYKRLIDDGFVIEERRVNTKRKFQQ